MGEFVKSEHFKKLNVGFALDEGIASPTDDILVYNAERFIWRKHGDFILCYHVEELKTGQVRVGHEH